MCTALHRYNYWLHCLIRFCLLYMLKDSKISLVANLSAHAQVGNRTPECLNHVDVINTKT